MDGVIGRKTHGVVRIEARSATGCGRVEERSPGVDRGRRAVVRGELAAAPADCAFRAPELASEVADPGR